MQELFNGVGLTGGDLDQELVMDLQQEAAGQPNGCMSIWGAVPNSIKSYYAGSTKPFAAKCRYPTMPRNGTM